MNETVWRWLVFDADRSLSGVEVARLVGGWRGDEA